MAFFTIPNSIVLPNSIIIRTKDYNKWGNQPSYSFLKLIQIKGFKGGLVSNRSYSSVIDNILKQHEQNSNITRRIVEADRHLLLLKHGRVDYIIEYPIVVGHITRYLDIHPDTFMSLAIKELPAYMFGHIALPKNKWGKEVALALNKVIKKLTPTRAYQNAIEKWFTRKREQRVIKKAFSDMMAAQSF